MKKTTLALSIITAFGLWGCVGSSSGDDQPIDQGNSQQRGKLINPSDNSNDNNNNDNGNSGNAGSTGGAGGATGHISGGSTGGQPIADDDKTGDDKTGSDDKEKCTVDPNALNCKKDDDDNKDKNKITAESVKIEQEAYAQKLKSNLEENKTLTDQKKALSTAKSNAENQLASLKTAAETARKNLAKNPTDAKLIKTSAEADAALAAVEKTLSDYEEVDKKLQKNKLENLALVGEGKEIAIKQSIVKAQDKKQPKSNLDLLNSNLALEKAKTEQSVAGERLSIANKNVSTTKQALDTAQTTLTQAQTALNSASDEDTRADAQKQVTEATTAKENADTAYTKAIDEQRAAQKDKDLKDKDVTTLTATKTTLADIDKNRALSGSAAGLSLSSFQDVASVKKEGNIWSLAFSNGESLVIDIDKAKIGASAIGEKVSPSSSSYYGDFKDGNAVKSLYDAIFGYSGDKFYSMGTVTEIGKIPTTNPASGAVKYEGTALLKASDNTDLVSRVNASVDFKNKNLAGSFYNFKSYDPATVVKNPGNNVKDYKDLPDKVDFNAAIDGNRFLPTGSVLDKDKAKVYGYFYGTTASDNNPKSLGGLVEYSKFHGSFGAKKQ